jgi:hypothetical protein
MPRGPAGDDEPDRDGSPWGDDDRVPVALGRDHSRLDAMFAEHARDVAEAGAALAPKRGLDARALTIESAAGE